MTQAISNHSVSALTIPNHVKKATAEEDIIWVGNSHGEIMAVDISSIDVTKLENEHTLNVVQKWRGHCKGVTNLTIVENHDLLGTVLFFANSIIDSNKMVPRNSFDFIR